MLKRAFAIVVAYIAAILAGRAATGLI